MGKINKYLLALRIVIISVALIIFFAMLWDILTKSKNQTLQAKLDGQQIILPIEEELKNSELRKIEQDQILTEVLMEDRAVQEAKKEIAISEIAQNYGDKNIISIIITGVGLSKSNTEKVFELPNNITLGFSPYAVNLSDQLKKALNAGYESLINVPMQTKDYPQIDPGRLGLIKDLSDIENFQRLQAVLESDRNYVGIYTLADEIFTNSAERMKTFLRYLQNRKLFYVYGGPSENFAFRQMAKQTKIKLIDLNVLIDENTNTEAMENQLSLLEKYSEKQGYAVGFINPYPGSLEILMRWLVTLEQKNIYVVPISILNKKMQNIK